MHTRNPGTPISYPCSPFEAMLPGIEVFDNRADYEENVGVPAPEFNPTLPLQFWRDTSEDRTQVSTEPPADPGPALPPAPNYAANDYNLIILTTVDGVAGVGVLTPCTINGILAAQVNLPDESQDAAAYDNRVQMQFPLDPEIEPEQIQSSPFGFTIIA